MKICQIHDHFRAPAKDSQGVERIIESVTRGLQLLGHEVVLKIHSDSKTTLAPIVSEVPQDCDILHFHQWEPERIKYENFKKPWVVSLHGLNGDGNNMDPRWVEATSANPHIIAGSQFVCNKIRTKAFVWSCSNSENFIYRDKKDDYFLWMAGTDWGEGKGLWSTINLAKRLGFKLKLAGSGQNQANIEKIKSLCDSKIEYVGSVNGAVKAELLAGAKALILLTRLNDACPTVVGEAMLSGTPVIGSTFGSMPEIVQHGKTGYICQNDSDFAKAIMNISHGKSMAENCRQIGEKSFSHIAAAERFLQFYQNMINSNRVTIE